MDSGRRIFFTDFDGTVARHDFYRLVLDTLDLDVEEDPWGAFLEGRRTHFEALAEIFGGIRADAPTLDALIDRMEPDPHLAADVTRLRDAGWEVHVVSAGSDYYIRRILEKAGLDDGIPVHSNPGRFVEGRGILLERAADPRIRSRDIGIDKAATLRLFGEGASRVVFAGDSGPDLEAAKLVAPDDRFARARLAALLDDLGLDYRPFERWHEVATALLG